MASTGDLAVRQTTLRGGQVTNSRGGGVLNEGSVTLGECTISGNGALFGGGVASITYDASQMILSNSTVSGNSAAAEGGGVYSITYGVSQMTLSNSTLSGNSANLGGGVLSLTLDASQMILSNSTVSGNSAAADGGGVWSSTHDASQVTLTNSTLSGNSAVSGGGVWSSTHDDSKITLSSSTVSGNSAARGGGVVSHIFQRSQATLQRMLIAGNRAENGAEVLSSSSSGTFTVDAFNLFGHSGLTTTAALKGFLRGPTDLLATVDGGSTYALSAILDPTLINNGGPTLTHNLVPRSPAIDAGGVCVVSTDQRGAPRPQGSAYDIGAVDFGEVEEICGNCVDDDGDGLADFADPDCTTEAVLITKERASFTLNPTPHSDQLTLTATLPGGHEVNPPQDGIGVQFIDDSGSLPCVHLPPAPGAWKTMVSGTGQTTWQFKDAPNGSLGDPSKDAGTVSFDPIKDTLTVKLTIKQTEIGGDATARDIRTGISSGQSCWQKLQRWTAKAGGKKLGTP